ncbi:hypothetical protein N8878_07685 [Psychromonas sp.]|nr:hypothetical protein [Psychromonas sp.]
MFNFWTTKDLVNEDDCEWIFNTYAFLLTHFDHHAFFQVTQLVQPTDTFFPGKINSPASMANTVFEASIKHCGLTHWPFQLQHPSNQAEYPLLLLPKSQYLMRRHLADLDTTLVNQEKIRIGYNPHQTTEPGDLAASFSHLLAQHIFAQSQLSPVGGDDLFLQNTEILAVMMGFGVMLSNSAYAFRGSCARCFNPEAHRQASLSEDKVIFSLALFCHLKEIPYKQATKHLKPYLRSLYKQAISQIKRHPDKVNALLVFNK